MDTICNGPFFGDAKSEPGYRKRIRAVIQNLNLDFADNITKRDHCREVTESKDSGHIFDDVIPITRNDFINHI